MFTEEERAFICLDWCGLAGRQGKAIRNADGSITVNVDDKFDILNEKGRQHRNDVKFLLEADRYPLDYSMLANTITYYKR